jgi:RNA polymerase sigma-70 factor (ECF subfamily)
VEIQVDALDAPGDAGDGAGTAARDQIDRAFRRLTPDQRAVLVLHHYRGLPDAEAADALGIPAGTFKSRLNRATVALRAAIEADERLAAQTVESVA